MKNSATLCSFALHREAKVEERPLSTPHQGILLNSVFALPQLEKRNATTQRIPAPKARNSLAHPEASECEAVGVGKQ
jgi:hypothetical protein